MKKQEKKGWPIWALNLVFVLVCAGLFLFLWQAPPVATPALPRDEEHAPFFPLPKKEAERRCGSCHGPGMSNPLPEKHPPPHRCLFCHRRN